MGPADRRQTQLIDKFGLRGSLFEQLIREPEGWADLERLQDSPNLQRYAMDVKLALEHEGWQAPVAKTHSGAAARSVSTVSTVSAVSAAPIRL